MSKKNKLIFNDVRKFGFVEVDKSDNLINNKHIKYLGPEPFSKEFNSDYFANFIKNRNTNLKSILMNQNFVSGLGNIYVNEAIFLSKINPHIKVSNLKKNKLEIIINNIRYVLAKAIKFGGSSIKDFSDSTGKGGLYQQKFKVYDREGLNCLRMGCKGTIIRRIISNRSTFFCDFCQK